MWRKIRLVLADVPSLSRLLFRWRVTFHNETVDYALTKNEATARSIRFYMNSGRSGWNDISVEPFRGAEH